MVYARLWSTMKVCPYPCTQAVVAPPVAAHVPKVSLAQAAVSAYGT